MSTTNFDLPVLMSADQIRRREFVAIRRGYDPGQVREFLEQVADHVQQMESMLREIRLEADSAIRAASKPRTDPYTQLAGRIAGVLRSVDDEAEKIRRAARTEAEHILSEARADADRIREDAEARAEETRTQAEQALSEARDQADRTIMGLSTKRDALVEQLAMMQERLVGVARELESTISAPQTTQPTAPSQEAPSSPPVARTGSDDEIQAWALAPQEEAGAAEGTEEETAETMGEEATEESSTIVLEEEPSDAEGEKGPREDDLDDAQLGLLDPAFDDLWDGTDAIGLQIPDIPPLDLDWGESTPQDEEDD